MRRYAALLAFASACTHHSQVTTLHPPAPGVEAIASLADGSKVEVVATSTPDGLRWVTRSTMPHEIIDPIHMSSYSTLHRGRGAVEGFAIGALTGVTVGAIAGFSSDCSDCYYSPSFKAEVLALGLGSVCAITGMLAGLAGGSETVYELETKHLPRVSATAENGGATAVLSWSY